MPETGLSSVSPMSSVGLPWKTATLWVLILASMIEKADENILPSVLINMRESFMQYLSIQGDISLEQLSQLTFIRAVFQALSSPIAGVLGDVYDRTGIILAGCLIWGAAMASIGVFSRGLSSSMCLCALNGIGIALAIPNISSMISDLTQSTHRGRVFGMMGFISNIGGMIGGAVATYVATMFPNGGWRTVFACLGLVSVLTGFLEYTVARDPRFKNSKLSPAHMGSDPLSKNAHDMKESMQFLWQIPSFRLLILQGIVGSMPWVSMSLFTVWLQTIGFSGKRAAELVAIFSFSCACGGVFGGWLGDLADTRVSKNHGRIFVGQVSIATGIPITLFLCWYGTYHTPSAQVAEFSVFNAYAILLSLLGLTCSWCGSNNSAIFTQIVPQPMLTRVFAFDRTFEGAIGALGAPLVGIIASHVFGFSFDNHNDGKALTKALGWCLIVPWCACLVFYSLLHTTYPKDRRRHAALTTIV